MRTTMNQTKEKLLQRIKEDLNDLSNTDPVYQKALKDLNQINTENSTTRSKLH